MWTSLALSLSLISPHGGDKLAIDPLLVAMAAEVWSVAADSRQSLWPGWDASKTPLLFYLPNVQDVLINHPNPPAGFRKLQGVPGLPFENVVVRDGKTEFAIDGQNTTREVNGIETLVVSDTLSQRKQWVESIARAAKSDSETLDQSIEEGLHPNPYGMMGMIAHEAFHVFQRAQAPGKGGNELVLMKYPALSAENNAGFALEAEYLRQALLARGDGDFRSAVLNWMAVRHGRRKVLSEECVAYEDATEFSEGLAKSMEYRLLEALTGRTPNDRMVWAQGFHGYGDLSEEKAGLLAQAGRVLAGEANVNDDPYGASPVRFRLYYSGMMIGSLLDRLSTGWKGEIFEEGSTLSGLARTSLPDVSDAELETLYAGIQASDRYRELFAQKTKLAIDGQRHIEELLAQIEGGPSTLVLDVEEWAGKPIGLAMTPFGILRVDDNRRFHRLIPFRAILGKFQVAASDARPVFHDNVARRYVLGLKGEVTPALLDRELGEGWRSGPVELGTLELPGATLQGGKVTFSLSGTTLKVRVHYPE